MLKFKVGDEVEMGIPKKEFVRNARNNSSTGQYISHIADGGTAIVDVVSGDDIKLKIKGLSKSNWFHESWFQLAGGLSAIRRESQRL